MSGFNESKDFGDAASFLRLTNLEALAARTLAFDGRITVRNAHQFNNCICLAIHYYLWTRTKNKNIWKPTIRFSTVLMVHIFFVKFLPL
jgi:hypothetical protein